ncbi:tRNA isopentenyltransferase, partial [Jaminaea rosea]
VIAIVGSTGTGKSQLGVEIAQHLASLPGPSSYQGAAILSSDSMQIYHNLDVITNKATLAEQGEVPHHLMSFLDPAKGERYDLQRFVREAKRVAEQECLDKGKVPIVVGGTIYWTQHLLCPGNVVERRGEGEDDNEGAGGWREPKDGALRLAFERMDEEQRKTWQNVVAGPLNSSSAETPATPSPREMHQLLTTLDPLMASRWHPLDGRKIANSLHVIARTGRRHSDWVKEQEQEQDDNAEASSSASIPHWSGNPLRTLLFWIYASRPELNARLDARVDKMIPRGLLDEIRTLRRIAAEARGSIDTSQGIFQAIGYKEFKPFLDALDDLERSGDGQAVSVLPAAGDMKSATRQYAKKQVGWMRNKLLPEIARTRRLRGEGVMEVVLLDATRPEEWEEKVRKPALKAVEAFMKGEAIP